jgi:hypothetical protein
VEKIFILCHSNGHFSVWKEPGTGHGSPILETREEADARAKVLQDEAGGAEKASIVVRDLTTSFRRQTKAPALRTPRLFGRV